MATQILLEKQEKQEKNPKKILLFEIFEPLKGTRLDKFQQISNQKDFYDRLYAAEK